MKKTLFSILMASAMSAQAAGWVSVDVDNVKGLHGASSSVAQYVRAGTDMGGYAVDLQVRTAKLAKDAGLMNSVETTVGKRFGIITPLIGIGHDNGFNGKDTYNYGLVGITAGMDIGSGYLLNGIKTRVMSTEDNRTKQTLGFITYSIPVTKTVNINLNASKSYQTIKENAIGMGLGIKF